MIGRIVSWASSAKEEKENSTTAAVIVKESPVLPQKITKSEEIILQNIISPSPGLARLQSLKTEKYLKTKLISRLSENVQYVILEYLNFKDLLKLRAVNTGGYQICTNKDLRGRVGNPPCRLIQDKIVLFLKKKGVIAQEGAKLKLICEIGGIQEIALEGQYLVNRLEDLGALNLGNMLSVISQIKELTLPDNDISSTGINSIAEGLVHLPDLIVLNLRENGSLKLFSNLIKIPKLKELNLAWNGIGETATIRLTQILKYFPNLMKLNLKWNDIGEEGGKELGNNLKFIPKLRKLNLIFNKIGPSTKYISDNLCYTPELLSLNMGGNNVEKKECEYLLEGLLYTPKLTKLNLKDNNIGEGATYISNILCFLTELTHLNLGWTSLEDVGQLEIIKNLKFLPKLRVLSLERAGLGYGTEVLLLEILKANKSLTKLEKLNLGFTNYNRDSSHYKDFMKLKSKSFVIQ